MNNRVFGKLLNFRAIGIGVMLSFVVMTTAVFAAPLGAWINGMPAEGVLGQPDFASNTPGATSSNFEYPYDIAIDSVNEKVFISEYANHRILRFSSIEALTNGGTAEAVLGQVDFTSNTANRGGTTAANTLNYPMGICIDSTGRLWVADSQNNRLLGYDNAANKTNGANADRVFGQADFTGYMPNRTVPFTPIVSSLRNPSEVSCDPNGRLWVVDNQNSRVLRFDSIASKANGGDADGVLGQANFTSDAQATTQSGLNQPIGITYTPSGSLFVSDWRNHRVLRFDNAASKANGANADGVLGQADFTSNVQTTTATGMRFSRGVEVDNAGALYISESSNHRVLVFNDAVNKANGAAADNVLGQADFTSGSANRGGGVAANTLNSPRLIYFDRNADILWLSDQGNNRILHWSNVTGIIESSNPETTSDPETLPLTGFPPDQITNLPEKNENKYQSFDNELQMEIPSLKINTSIVGVPRSAESWDVSWLNNQAGWLQGTAFPTWSGNSVLTAHVVDANGEPGLFTNLQDIKWGDQIIIKAWDQEYIYEVQSIDKRVKADDISLLEHEDFPWLTLITCKGYDKTTGTYRWRVVVRAVQVDIK